MDTILIYGSKGWIGGMLVNLLRTNFANEYQVVEGNARLEYLDQIESEIEELNKEGKRIVRVINCAGRTGTPNVDWCENNKDPTALSNIVGPILLSSALNRQNPPIHLTYIGSGCIYEYDSEHEIPKLEEVDSPNVIGFNEEDPHNFTRSYYSFTKSTVENILSKTYPNTLTLRLRMPISDDLHPRSLITKILKYPKIINIPNSMSVLYDLLPIIIDMSIKKKTGVYNFTNPGSITHPQLLALYKEHIDPQIEWNVFTVEEQDKILLAPRSNNYMDTSKLEAEYPDLPSIHNSLLSLFKRMKNNNQNNNE